MLNSLSGRFLLLTIVFVMLAEVFIFVPSIARFREDYLMARIERAQIASLTLLSNDMIDEKIEQELLDNAGVYNVVLHRDEARQLVLSSPLPSEVVETFDLRSETVLDLIIDALARLVDKDAEVVRVIGYPTMNAGQLIEVTLNTLPLRTAMVDYGLRVLGLSALISVITAILLFLAVRIIIVRPIRGVVNSMQAYAQQPENAQTFIQPKSGLHEMRAAEESLSMLQTQLTGALKQKQRLAQLGEAVAKVSHDLRNILTSAQLFTDRIEGSDDPVVQRLAPKLVGSISRAVSLTEGVLAFGKAEEPAPTLTRIRLAELVADVLDAERLAVEDYDLSFAVDIPETLWLRADPEQLYRALSNLIRNAGQAIVATGKAGEIGIRADEDDSGWTIFVVDTGPGLPPRAQEHLFQPFQGGVRKGGTGLGLAISADLIRGHGGELHLVSTGPEGTAFEITLPKEVTRH